MKLGTGSNTGIATFKIEAGTTKIHLHVAGWNGDGTHDLIVKTNVGNFAGITDPQKNRTITIPLTNDEGISGSTTTMTLAHPELASTTYYKEIGLENVTGMATITLETSAKRAVVWGVNAEITKITYKITYDGNGFTGGEVPVDNTEYEKGDEGAILEPGTMSKYGYEFTPYYGARVINELDKKDNEIETNKGQMEQVKTKGKTLMNFYNSAYTLDDTKVGETPPQPVIYYREN